jgi:hypothetical protein
MMRYKEYVINLYKTMLAENLTLVYEGEINQRLTKAFSEMAVSSMEEEEAEKVKNRVFHVMIECLQNIAKHSYESEQEENLYSGKGLLVIGQTDDEYIVTTGNRVENEKAEVIREVLENLNKLNRDDIKELYKKKIRESRLSDKGGAGLGLIDIVKKTGNKIEYGLMPMEGDTSFLILISKVDRKL